MTIIVLVLVAVSSLLAGVLRFISKLCWLRYCERIAAAHPKTAPDIIRESRGPFRERGARKPGKT